VCQQPGGTVGWVSSEQLAGAVVLAALGLGCIAVGALGRRGSLDFSLGGWTRDIATPESWIDAHRVMGSWFVGGVVLTCAGAVVAVVAVPGAAGPIVVATSVVLLVSVVVGVVSGTNRLVAQ